jgi:hypothetical protein
MPLKREIVAKTYRVDQRQQWRVSAWRTARQPKISADFATTGCVTFRTSIRRERP